jgi:hypothetical protein
MSAFLEVEARRISETTGRSVSVSEVVRALVTSYYEKRMAGLVVHPDD